VYAVIRTGGKQYKVKVGDVIDVERIGAGDGANVELVPLLVVDDEGKVSSRPSELVGAKVTASVVAQHRGEKLRVFTYKNKTGQRHHQGHRQSLTRIKVEGIDPPGTAKAAARGKTTTRSAKDTDADAKATTGSAAGTETAEATAGETNARATEAKAAEPEAGEAKAKDGGAKAKAADAKETGAKARTTRAAGAKAKAGEAKEAKEAKDTESKPSKPAGRGTRARAKQDEES
jgi:large subunit ribosomal protein L21